MFSSLFSLSTAEVNKRVYYTINTLEKFTKSTTHKLTQLFIYQKPGVKRQ